MGKELVPIADAKLAKLEQLRDQAGDYMRASKAENTWRAYKADWADFAGWCAENDLLPLPAQPATVALYLAERADSLKVSTLSRRLAAIVQMHSMSRHPDPTKGAEVKECWRGIRRTKGIAQKGKAPAIVDVVRQLIGVMPNNAAGIRDRAMMLLGFAGAFRRSELVGLNVDDLQFTRAGLVITLRRSKTDQEGEGRKIGIPTGAGLATDPIRAVQEWLALAAIKAGPIFRAVDRHQHISPDRLSAQTVALVIKRYAERAGLDPVIYAGHSLRAGLATSAAAAGASERAIMSQTGHKNVQMVRRYIRDGELFKDNAAGKVGL